MPQLPTSTTSMSPVSYTSVCLDIDKSMPTETMKFNIDDNYEKINSKKEPMLDFNIFYENLLGNQNSLYSLNSSLFNESFNICLNKVYHGRNVINNDNNKSFSIDSILGFANKESGNNLLYEQNHQTILAGTNGFEHIHHPNHNHHNRHQIHFKTNQPSIYSNTNIKKVSSLNEQNRQTIIKQDEHMKDMNNIRVLNNEKNNQVKGCKRLGLNEKKSMKHSNKNLTNNFGTTNINTKSKRVRTIFTPEQLERLETEFEKQQYMVGTGRLYLASTLNLTEAQVKVWFQNRRIKWRKQHLEGYQDNMDQKDKNNNSHENDNKTFNF